MSSGWHTQRGFTVGEVTIAMTVLIPILLGIVASTQMMNSAMDSSTRAADLSTYAHRMGQKIAKHVRAASMSSIRVRAGVQDVLARRAESTDEWISPTDLVWRLGIEFRAPNARRAPSAEPTEVHRRIVFTLDPTESDNDSDDDGDGLIDEGQIELIEDDATVAVIPDIEQCVFALDGRVLQMRLRVARRHDLLHRHSVEYDLYLRNN